MFKKADYFFDLRQLHDANEFCCRSNGLEWLW